MEDPLPSQVSLVGSLPSQVRLGGPLPSQVSLELRPAVGVQVGKARLPVRRVVVVVGCSHLRFLGQPVG